MKKKIKYYVAEGDLVFDDELVTLRGKEKLLLDTLLSSEPDYVTREQLCSSVWAGRYVTDFTINQTVNSLRKKLRDAEKKIVLTMPRRGYSISVQLLDLVTETVLLSKEQQSIFDVVNKWMRISKQVTRIEMPRIPVRAIVMLGLFLIAGAVGVGLASILELGKKEGGTVFVNYNKYELSDSVVRFMQNGQLYVCILTKEDIEREQEPYGFKNKTSCSPEL